MISSGIYHFNFMLWPPRLATLLALVVACLVFASIDDSTAAEGGRRPSTLGVGLLVVVSWGLQILLLAHLGYSPGPRLNVTELLSGRHYGVATVPKDELRFLRCLAARLPGGLPISTAGDTHPLFHRQSIVFQKEPMHRWHDPRLSAWFSRPMRRPLAKGRSAAVPGWGPLPWRGSATSWRWWRAATARRSSKVRR